ncbi:MAG TPA: Ig-like domain-containing protein [Gemmatimonadaceae bacterium]|nr:Ig-like domain-containing protein [Gemmatimonadaceae bacterium]
MHLVTRRLGALALAVSPFVVACGGDDPNEPRDRSRPTLVAIDPANGSTNVERDLLVIATFSKALDPASVTTSTFTVKTAAGATVPGIVEADSADVGFLATTRLAYSTDYVITITSGIRDRAGNAAVPTSTTFRTEANFPPQVVVTTPPNGATSVAVNTSITVGFSENVLPSSVNATTFTVTPTGGTAIAGTIIVDNAIATFTPGAPLMTGTTYTVRLTSGITDLDGASLGATYTFSFTTPPNQAPSANAGPSQEVDRGELVQLSGSGTDPEGEALTYKWTQTIGPDVTGGVGYLTGQSPSFTAPSEVSSVRFELRTTDARGATSQGSIVDIGVFEDKAHRIFVSPSGNDANPGTRAAPVKTINRGVQVAAAEGADVYVTNGLYDETVNLATGVSIYGGYQSGTWLRSAPPTFIRGASALNVGVFGQNVSNLTLDGLDISANEPTVLGGSAYGVFLINAQNITVTRDSIRAGPGQVGTGGQFGFPGAHGQGGGRGGDAVCSATPTPGAGGSAGLPMSPSAGSQPGVAGGAGGSGGAPNAPGSSGTNGQSAGTSSGGSGGPGGAVGGNGNAGGFGTSGLDGAHGIGGAGFGTFTATGYTPANGSDATPGTTGSAGGGGGGGGAAASSAGGGGGGGGAGGGGGNYGQGGKGGGGSFAFVALNSTGIVLDGNVITSHNGGFGGEGGRGGNGGNGGPGNVGGQGCGPDGGNGGTGGPGGAGGSGGHGGGGGGGPSIAIVEGATSQITIGPNNILEHGSPGPGGTSQAGQSIGATGIAVLHKKLP